MTRRLILHAGDCKTGSTTLQSMLARGAFDLPGRRLAYPAHRSHAILARSLAERGAQYRKSWTRVADRLAETDWDVAVLSSELFEFSNPERLKTALDTFLPGHVDGLQIVAYIRPHAARALSQFAENLKLGHDTQGFDAFLDRILPIGRLRYAERLARWQALFGDRLTVRPFLRDRLEGGDVRRDFLSILAEGGPYTLTDGAVQNESLPLADLALMRHLQRRFQTALGAASPSQVIFGKHFADILRARPAPEAGPSLRLPRHVHDRLLAKCRKDAEAMDRDWWGAPLFLPALEDAARDVVDAPQSLAVEDHVDAQTLRLADCWADLMIRQLGDAPREVGKRLRPPGGD